MPHSAPLSRTTARAAPTHPRGQRRHEKVMAVKDVQVTQSSDWGVSAWIRRELSRRFL